MSGTAATSASTSVVAAREGAGDLGARDAPPRPLTPWAAAGLLSVGVVVALVNLADPSQIARSVVFNGLGVLAVAAAAYGIVRNRPQHAEG